MTLLIVDDEDLTREGLKKAIEAMKLPIRDIAEADDGFKGLKAAEKLRPDIILSDIRMAHMSGIDMADSLKLKLPDTVFIFMSGYSDREYLKAAIRLKAVSFIEKPIDLKELKSALKDAIHSIEEGQSIKQSRLISGRASAERLALALTLPPGEAGDLTQELENSDIDESIRRNRHITVFLIKTVQSLDALDRDERKRISEAFDKALTPSGCGEINIEKHGQYIVYHVFSPSKLSEKEIKRTAEALKQCTGDKIRFFISVGGCISGMENAYNSYNRAVLLMQSAFFNDYGCIIYGDNGELLPAPKVLPDPSEAYLMALLSGDTEKVKKTEAQIFASLSDARNLMPNQVRDIYYKLFSAISDAYRKLSIDQKASFPSSESLLSFVQECNTLKELSDALHEKSSTFLNSMAKDEPENPAVLSIKEYISHNYSREDLSVKEISDYVHMTSSYVCTLFKNETGITLSQYITLFRMDKAKELLSDPKYKIVEISDKVGYADGNYFGKSFKKTVGMTPGEYRARVLL